MSAILEQAIDLKAGGLTFVFRVPTPVERAKLGLREVSLRRQLDPVSGGWPDGLDMDTFNLVRGFAILQLYLKKTDATWVYTMDATGKPIVDIEKFPTGVDAILIELGREFVPALERFHSDRAESGRLPLPKDVEGSEHPGSL